MNNKYLEIFKQYGLNFGNCVGSKSYYRKENPHHLIVFNSRIYLKPYYELEKDKSIRDFFKGQQEEIWYGDLDLNNDIYDLYKISLEIGQTLVITSEMGNKVVEVGTGRDKNWIGFIQNGKDKKGIIVNKQGTGLTSENKKSS